jgi:hypothetical protein
MSKGWLICEIVLYISLFLNRFFKLGYKLILELPTLPRDLISRNSFIAERYQKR